MRIAMLSEANNEYFSYEMAQASHRLVNEVPEICPHPWTSPREIPKTHLSRFSDPE